MIRLQKRSNRFHIDCQIGSTRMRGALGTKDKTVASRLKSRIELALAEGARSEKWIDLQRSLPSDTYERFAKANGLKIEVVPTWGAVESIFWTDCAQRVKLGRLSPNTVARYEYAVNGFRQYLAQNHQGNDTHLGDISPDVIEDYKVERLEQILAKPNAESGNGLAVEVSVLHSMFEQAVERRMIDSNPVRKSHVKAESEVNPFSGQELHDMRSACETDEEALIYTVLRHTGLRVSDAADLQWSHVQKTEIVKRTLKRGVVVHIPMSYPLLVMLGTVPRINDHVINIKNNPVTTAQIRQVVRLTSRKASVKDATPHRYRHSLAVDLLLKGASVYEVAKVLGDSVATVEKHYLKFVPEMRQKLKGLLDDTTKGLESQVTDERKQMGKGEQYDSID